MLYLMKQNKIQLVIALKTKCQLFNYEYNKIVFQRNKELLLIAIVRNGLHGISHVVKKNYKLN